MNKSFISCMECKKETVGMVMGPVTPQGFTVNLLKCTSCGYVPTGKDLQDLLDKSAKRIKKISSRGNSQEKETSGYVT